MEKKKGESIKELAQTTTRLLSIYRKLGLEDNLDDAIKEVELLINMAKAHHEYVEFKRECAKHPLT